VTIRNSGLAPLTIDDIRISEDGAQDFLTATGDCRDEAIPPGKVCVVGVFFAPHHEGRRTAELAAKLGGVEATAQLLLTGIASARGDFQVEPVNIAFGDQAVGTASREHSTQISTIASIPVRIRDVRIVEDTNSEFEVGNNTCTHAIARGETCAVAVRFHPQVSGERTAQLELVDDSGDAAHRIRLTGHGTAADLSLAPEQISFPATQVGQRSESESAMVRNSGDGDVHLGAVGLLGDASKSFILDKGSCDSATLRSGAACRIQVQFQPVATGRLVATISLADDTPDGPHTIRLEGTGTEVAQPSAQIYAKSFSFGWQAVGTTSKPLQVWVASRGKTALTIGNVDFAGGRPRSFGLKTNCSQTSLKPNNQCEVDVYFSPAEPGEAHAHILVPHNAPDAQTYFDVDGVGISREVSWCCLEGRVFEVDENTCRARAGRSYPDATTAKAQCSVIPAPTKSPQAETPSGLEPGTSSPSGSRAIACESVTLHWSAAPAPGGYLVSIARLVPGSDAGMRVLFSQHVFTNAYKVPSALETGSYEWSVTSLGSPGQRNASAPPSYFLCAARTNVTGRPKVAARSNLKAKASSVISAPIQ